MRRSSFMRAFAVLATIAMFLAPAGFAVRSTLAFEQGAITVAKTWAAGQEPAEIVETCFRVTADEAGADLLGSACTTDASYTVVFGPTAPDLQTGVIYYVWEVVAAGWEVAGENPVAVVIPDTTGEAAVSFENRRIDGAWIEVHESICPAGFASDDLADYAEACRSTPRAGVEMSAAGPDDRFTLATTDAKGELLFAGYTTSGEVTIAESVPTGDFVDFVVGCTRLDTDQEIPIDERTNGRAAFALDLTAELADGDVGIRCEWYNIPPAPPVETASLTIHASVCPADVDPNDRFDLCHANGIEGITYTLDGPVQRDGVTTGNLGAITWDELPAGIYGLTQTTPVEDSVGFDAYCSRVDNDEPVNVAPHDGDEAAIAVEIGAGAQVVCDWYILTEVATPTSTPTETPPAELTLAISPQRGQAGTRVTFTGAGYTPGGDVVVLMTGDGLIVADTTAAADGSISGSFRAPNREQLTGESGNAIPVFAIDEATGRESARVTFTYVSPLPTPTATATATPTSTPTPTPVIGRPVHIHHGVCGALDPDWSIALTDLTTPVAGPNETSDATVAESSFTLVDISLDELLAGGYAINAHPSHERMRPFVACGEIGGPVRADGSVVIGLREQNGSGLSGIVYLSPDPADPDRTRVSVFLAPGLAEEDPTLVPARDGLVLHSVVNNGPVSPKYQEGYEITVYADGRVEIVVTPQGASSALAADERTARTTTLTARLSRGELIDLLTTLDEIGFFQLTREPVPDDLLVGGPGSLLTVTTIDGVWEANLAELRPDGYAVLEAAQHAVADAVDFEPTVTT